MTIETAKNLKQGNEVFYTGAFYEVAEIKGKQTRKNKQGKTNKEDSMGVEIHITILKTYRTGEVLERHEVFTDVKKAEKRLKQLHDSKLQEMFSKKGLGEYSAVKIVSNANASNSEGINNGKRSPKKKKLYDQIKGEQQYELEITIDTF